MIEEVNVTGTENVIKGNYLILVKLTTCLESLTKKYIQYFSKVHTGTIICYLVVKTMLRVENDLVRIVAQSIQVRQDSMSEIFNALHHQMLF